MIRRALAVPLLACLTAAPQVVASPAPPSPSSPPLEALAGPLAQTVMASLAAQPCQVEIAMRDLSPVTAGCDQPADGAPAAAGADLELTAAGEVRTPRWGADLAPIGGGRMARVHGYGDVAVHRLDGEVDWVRPGWSFYEDWGIDPWIVPIVPMGASPIDPFEIASERPFAVGDLTGDGTGDIAISHHARRLDPETLLVSGRSFVTIVDGEDGTTRWFREYPGYVTQLLVAGDRLLVGNETGSFKALGGVGQDGTTTTLSALTLEPEGQGLVASETWRFDTGTEWARLLALEPANPGSVAVAYTSKPLGASGSGGRVRLLDDGSGERAWEVPTSGYPRALRYDPVRDRIVVHEQADPVADANGRQSYWITGLNTDTGLISARISRAGAVLTSFEIGDIVGGPEPEWLTGDLQQLPQTPNGIGRATYQAMRVMAADGANPTTLWTHSVQMPSDFVAGRGGGLASWPVPYAVTVGGPAAARHVVVATLHGYGDGLRALRGADGSVAWQRYGSQTFPLFLTTRVVESEPAVVAVSRNQVFRAFSVSDGSVRLEVPLVADTYAAVAAHVNADGTSDLLVGGESGAVFALDGSSLDDDPHQLWRTTVGTAVRRVELADLDGDGDDELVVAATSRVAALDPATGEQLWGVDRPNQFLWTFGLGQLDGQPGLDVVVPERNLLAIRGATGSILWDHDPVPQHYFSTPVVTPDGMVVAQALVKFPDPLAPRHHRLTLGLDAGTGEVIWEAPQASQFSNVRLWDSVTAAGPTADGQGTRVAATWEPGSLPAVSTPGSGITTDVFDSRTGAVLVTHPAEDQGVVPMATVFEPGRGLFEVNWKTVQQLEPQPVEVVWEATSDVAWADFGEKGEAFLRAWHHVFVHQADAPTGGRGTDHPAPVAEYSDLYSGRMTVADLDGDGSDEVIAVPFDWPGYAQVAGFAGIGVIAADLLPHGIAVLEAG